MFKIYITRECHFASASVVFDDGHASAIVDFGLRCTPGEGVGVMVLGVWGCSKQYNVTFAPVVRKLNHEDAKMRIPFPSLIVVGEYVFK